VIRRSALTALLAVLLAACSSTPHKPKPAELAPSPELVKVQSLWSAKIGEVAFALDARVHGQQLAVAASDGTVAVLDVNTGADIWRASVGAALSAGVGFDGQVAAVVTRDNELVALQAGRTLWRQRLSTSSLTAPLVAGARVFVLGADRSVQAFDGQSGRRLWQQQRPGEALVLRQSGVLLAVGDTLVAGLSGKLVGLHPLNGNIRWEAPIASPRGTNDVERLVDLVAPVSREGDVVCARAFQAAVGCVDATRGAVTWSKPAAGYVGVQGDAQTVFASEADGLLVAWRRTDGERLWQQEGLRYRALSAPLVMDRLLVVGDDSGWLHILSARDGSVMGRVGLAGAALAGAPVRVGQTLVAVTRGGDVLAFRPE
jgi:outer membrane assembly lipoprotein YfgL